MSTGERATRRQVLARITLAVDLPAPTSVSFYDERGLLVIDLETVAEGLAWAEHLGGAVGTYTSTNDGRLRLDAHAIEWLGWRLLLGATDPTPDPGVSDADRAALTQVAEGGKS